MAKKRKQPDPVILGPFAAGEVTAANFVKKALAFVKAGLGAFNSIRNIAGAKALHKVDTPERWCAWLAFFAIIGHRSAVSLADRQGVYTVPAEWPWDFSADGAAIEGRLHALVRSYRLAAQEPLPLERQIPPSIAAYNCEKREKAIRDEEAKRVDAEEQLNRAKITYCAPPVISEELRMQIKTRSAAMRKDLEKANAESY